MDTNLYHSKLRSPNRAVSSHQVSLSWDHPSSSTLANTYDGAHVGHHVQTPNKNINNDLVPHRSGYFLRTPSPLKKIRSSMSPSKAFKSENPATPSPHKPTSATDLFGNKSLLDNLDVPEDWDENFLNNFQDDWLFAFGSEDLESLTNKSPLKSPRRGLTFLSNTPKKISSGLSPFKSPLLTSSPKLQSLSPVGERTPGGRPLTRQRKLFLQSPDRRVSEHSVTPLSWSDHVPLDSSSHFNVGRSETTIQSISSYLKNFDEEESQEELPVMPPAGWTSQSGKTNRVGKVSSRVSSKSVKSKREKTFTALQNSSSANISFHPSATVTSAAQSHVNHAKRIKTEPQFTLLRPFTDFQMNQISLRTTPVTPPNKIKISRDFSQIQTLPSKEQLRIVRNRFRDTLNKAVQQVIENEKSKGGASSSQQQQQPKPPQQTTSSVEVVSLDTNQVVTPVLFSQEPQQQHHPTPIQFNGLLPACGVPQYIAVKPPPLKKRRR